MKLKLTITEIIMADINQSANIKIQLNGLNGGGRLATN
jgi:hypothetical protein